MATTTARKARQAFIDGLVKAIGGVRDGAATRARELDEQLGAMSRRLERLEDRHTLSYCGVWSATESYSAGDCVTLAGSLWIARAMNRAARPGGPEEPSRSWVLAVKRGDLSERDR